MDIDEITQNFVSNKHLTITIVTPQYNFCILGHF
jgi:hypothetical protein